MESNTLPHREAPCGIVQGHEYYISLTDSDSLQRDQLDKTTRTRPDSSTTSLRKPSELSSLRQLCMHLQILGRTGLAKNHWPLDIASKHKPLGADEESCVNVIPYTLEGLAECTIIDAYRPPRSDRTRKIGIFTRQDVEQTHVNVRFYGFIKESKMSGYGTWNGAFKSAFRACLRLEIDGKNCEEAFGPQLSFVKNVGAHVAHALQGNDTTILDTSLRFEHQIFRKATTEDRASRFNIHRGEDPMGKLARVAKEWRLKPKPLFYKRTNNDELLETTALSFQTNDFVEVLAHPEIIFRDGHGQGPSKIQVCLTFEVVTRLFNEEQLMDIQLPAMMLQMTTKEEGGDTRPKLADEAIVCD
ncbi:hypothetical protein NM688_g14 [Phlebia brevispora]|uniref:Uncharacterized protein n=1 Tax=Phlebia brevispora TaxID=194682 RepID=A0ACC1TFJ1_9APHY|nr:hypothetical protein NM688_g14 [Phlebia brevispora]